MLSYFLLSRPFLSGLLFIFITNLFFSGCENKVTSNSTSSGQIQLFLKDHGQNQQPGELGYVRITVKKTSGETSLSNFKIQLIQSENDYVSLPFRLPSGHYFLSNIISFNKAGIPVSNYFAAENRATQAETQSPFYVKTNQLLSIRLNFSNPVHDGVRDSIYREEQPDSTDYQIQLTVNAYNPQLDSMFAINGTVQVQLGEKPVSLVYLGKGSTHLSIKKQDSDTLITLLIKSPSYKDTTITLRQSERSDRNQTVCEVTLNPVLPIKKQMIAWYPFDGNSKDLSGNNYHGKEKQIVYVKDRFGKDEKAIQCKKDSQILIGDVFNDLNFPFTISYWLKTNYYNPKIDDLKMRVRIFDSDFNPHPIVFSGIQAQYINGFVSISIGNGAGFGYQYRKNFIARKFLGDGKWYLVTSVAKSPKDMAIFINNQSGNCRYISERYNGKATRLEHSTSPAVIGALGEGILDDLRIYNYALSEAQIDSLYHEGGWK